MTPAEKIERLEKALRNAGGYHTWADVKEGLIEGKYQIFDSDEGAAVTEIIQTPQKRYLSLWIAGGRLPGVLDLVPRMEQHALTHDCAEILACGRLGWERVLPHYGWKKTGAIFSKEPKNA